jgi:two-component system nitrogen regulation sensor histidine kinase NtrY
VTVKRVGELRTFLTMLGTVILIRFLSYRFGFPDNFADEELFSPDLFASDFLNISLGDTFINMSLMFWLLVFFVINIQGKIFSRFKSKIFTSSVAIFCALGVVALIVYLSNLSYEIIHDSVLNYDTTLVSEFGFYSFVGLMTFALIFSNFVLITLLLHGYCKTCFRNLYSKYVLIAVFYLLFYFFIPKSHEMCYYLAFLSLGVTLLLLDSKYLKIKFDFNSYNLLIWFIIISGIGALFLSLLIDKKENKIRKEYANRILFANDKSVENKLFNSTFEIANDSFLNASSLNSRDFDFNEFSSYFFKKYLKENFGKFDQSYYFFDSTGKNLNPSESISVSQYMDEINRNSSLFEIMDDIYFYESKLKTGYFMKVHLAKSKGFLICKLEEQIIFDNDDFNQIVEMDLFANRVREYKYSIAIYFNQELVTRKGQYGFPQMIPKIEGESIKFISKGDYSEMWYKPEMSNKVIIIAKRTNFLYLFTTLFAYLFFMYFVTVSLYIIGNIVARSNLDWRRFLNLLNVNLRLRVHVAILSVVLCAFIAVGISTSFYLSNRVRDKLKTEISNNGEMIQQQLDDFIAENNIKEIPDFNEMLGNRKMIDAFSELTDKFNLNINIYQSSTGKLAYSSNPELFHYGLISKYINPISYFQIKNGNLDHYINYEKIENFEYLTSYNYLKNVDGKPIGILQIPNINSNKTIASENSSILVTLINIYAFVFLFSSILAFFITKSVTRSFTYIIKQFTKINLTKINQPLKWGYSDEIGLLVKEYNRMLRKLENSTMQLAKTEREMAWREMAKQVAHEIKNPLTPIKLSLQMLERAIKNKNPNVMEMTSKVTGTIIEQIDNLSLIATNFSNFAKMPELKKEYFDLNVVLYSVTGMYIDDSMNEFLFIIPDYPITVYADKSQLIRVFTNIIQNAIQAVPDDRKGNISMEVTKIRNNFVRVTIMDNGDGISDEMASKLFQPYFTTKSSGTGLGLAMCKDIVEQCGGRISFDSKLNQGTEFYIDLPISSDEDEDSDL